MISPKRSSLSSTNTIPDFKTYSILIRVTDSNKEKSARVKLSTVVEPENLDAFWNKYTNVLKAGFVGLKKKSKSKKKTKKASKKFSTPHYSTFLMTSVILIR